MLRRMPHDMAKLFCRNDNQLRKAIMAASQRRFEMRDGMVYLNRDRLEDILSVGTTRCEPLRFSAPSYRAESISSTASSTYTSSSRSRSPQSQHYSSASRRSPLRSDYYRSSSVSSVKSVSSTASSSYTSPRASLPPQDVLYAASRLPPHRRSEYCSSATNSLSMSPSHGRRYVAPCRRLPQHSDFRSTSSSPIESVSCTSSLLPNTSNPGATHLEHDPVVLREESALPLITSVTGFPESRLGTQPRTPRRNESPLASMTSCSSAEPASEASLPDLTSASIPCEDAYDEKYWHLVNTPTLVKINNPGIYYSLSVLKWRHQFERHRLYM